MIEITVQKYVEKHRPPEHIRPELDRGYSIDGQKIYINEIRPDWRNPEIIRHRPYAKIWYIKSSKIFRLYWMRASGNWELYEPFPESTHLQELLDVVHVDKLGCFKG